MKYLIILFGMPVYIVLSIFVGKFVYHLLAPELTFIGELSLLTVEGAKVDGPTVAAFIVTFILILTACVATAEWWSEKG